MRTIAREFNLDKTSNYTVDGRISVRSGHAKIAVVGGSYPTEASYLRFAPYNPQALSAWRGIRVFYGAPFGTSVAFRVSNGTDDLYHDGSAWVEATEDGHWNTHAELEVAFQSFPVESKTAALVAKLVALPTVTPWVQAVSYCLDVRIDYWQDEYTIDTMIAELKKIRPRIPWLLNWTGGDTADLSSYRTANGMTLLDVLEAYDEDADPDHETNLLVSFSAGELTLSEELAAGAHLYVVIVPVIAVAVATHVDYNQSSRLPSIVIRDIEVRHKSKPYASAYFRTGDTTAISVRPTEIKGYKYPIDVYYDRVQGTKIVDAIKEHFLVAGKIVRTPGAGFDLRLDVYEDSGFYPRSDEESVIRATITLMAHGCEEWYNPPQAERVIVNPVVETNP